MAGPTVVAANPKVWTVRGFDIRVDRPIILGVINLTPDSFSDGGSHADAGAALAHAQRLVDDGADLVDVGGESTRPGASAVDATEEWSRIGQVVEGLALRGIPVSIDTTKADVAQRAVDSGAAVLNDVSGLRHDPSLADVAARAGSGLIVMHMRGTPRTMQDDVEYEDLVGEVRDALGHSMQVACDRGCTPEQIVVDPGIGFGKSPAGNLELIAGIGRLLDLGRPVLIGPSRKAFIGAILDVPVEERLEGTIAACTSALARGARLFRVHDVLPVRRALDVAWAIRNAGTAGQAT
jgi:dihydropteroate synthase